MNKEKRKFKKVIKAKKRRERKKKILENNKTIHKIVRSIKKTWFLDEKKKRSKIIKDLNQKKIKELRKILNIPDTQCITINELEKMYSKMKAKIEKSSKISKVEKD